MVTQSAQRKDRTGAVGVDVRRLGDTDRGDLSERLARARKRINDPRIRVIVAGQLKQGKSQLVNSLLNLNVCKVGDDESTAVATVVSYSEKPWARLVVERPDGSEPEVVEIPTSDLKNDLRRAPQAGGREVIRVEVGAPSPMLKSGLALVDTPGVGGYGQPHLAATLGLLPDADAVLMVSDLSQEFTEPEMTFMRQAFEICPGRNDRRDENRHLPALARHRLRQHHTPATRAGGEGHAE